MQFTLTCNFFLFLRIQQDFILFLFVVVFYIKPIYKSNNTHVKINEKFIYLFQGLCFMFFSITKNIYQYYRKPFAINHISVSLPFFLTNNFTAFIKIKMNHLRNFFNRYQKYFPEFFILFSSAPFIIFCNMAMTLNLNSYNCRIF